MQVKEKLEQSLKLLGVDTDMETFSNRKRLQKLTYLLDVFGIKLGFKFSWYLHGPYSTSLTKVLYKKNEEELKRDVKDYKEDKKKIESLKKFLGRDINSSNTLELIVSLHYIIKLGRSQNLKDDEIFQLFHRLKPFFSVEEARYYYKRVGPLIE
jgi:uncharacterized protein YwgA